MLFLHFFSNKLSTVNELANVHVWTTSQNVQIVGTFAVIYRFS